MNKKILFLILLGVLILPSIALAQTQASVIAGNIEQLTLTIGVCIVVIGWVIAGILYLTAAGAPDKTGIAKKAMIAALMGTILIVIAAGGYSVISGIVNSALNSGQ